MDYQNIDSLKKVFREFKVWPQPRLGQNFLIDRSVSEKLISSAQLKMSDWVVEIGAGAGNLTAAIATSVERLTALEIDPLLVPLLGVTTKEAKNVEIWTGDALDFDYEKFFSGVDFANRKVVGSIPYQITSPLLHRLFFQEHHPFLICWLIQKEVAEKMTVKPPRASYLSNLIGYIGKAEIIKNNIKPSSFWPQPKVESAIIKISLQPDINLKTLFKFSKFLHRGFSSPRKMLSKSFDKRLLENLGIDPQLRPQHLSLIDWLKIFSS